MRSLFQRQPPALLGIDVGTTSIKLVELARGAGGRCTVLHCAQELLAPGWVSGAGIERFDEVADALRRLVGKSGSRTRRVALALPLSAVIQKRARLPAGLSEQEMEFQAESEASQYIPFSLDEVSLDYSVIGPAAGAAGVVEVLIAAARKEMVQDRQGLAEAAGLRPVVIELESNASALAALRLIGNMPHLGRDALVALVDIGGRAASLQVLHRGEVLHARDQAFSGSRLTQLLMRRYGLSEQEAEQRKRSGALPADYAAAVLGPFAESVAVQVRRALQRFFSSTAHRRIDHVLLAGGSAALGGLAQAITGATGLAATVANPFDGMAMRDAAASLGRGAGHAGYLTACGLALRGYAT